MEQNEAQWSKNEEKKGDPKMLGGEFRHNLDPKNRIFSPSKLREELGASFVIEMSWGWLSIRPALVIRTNSELVRSSSIVALPQ